MAIDVYHVEAEAKKQNNLQDTIAFADALNLIKNSKDQLTQILDQINDTVNPKTQDPEKTKNRVEWEIRYDEAYKRVNKILNQLKSITLKDNIFDKIFGKDNQEDYDKILSEIVSKIEESRQKKDIRWLGLALWDFLLKNKNLINKIEWQDNSAKVRWWEDKRAEVKKQIVESFKDLIKENELLKQPVETYLWTDVEISDTLKSLKGMLDNYQEKYNTAYSTLSAQRLVVETIEKDIHDLTFRVIEKQKEKDKNEKDLEAINKEIPEKIDQGKLKQLEKKWWEIQEDINKLEDQKKQKEQDLSSEQNKIPELEVSVTTAQDQLDKTREDYKKENISFWASWKWSLESNKIEPALQEINISLSKYKADIDNANWQIRTIQSKIDDLLKDKDKIWDQEIANKLDSLQLQRTAQIDIKLSNIKQWMDNYIRWYYVLKQKYYVENKIADEKVAPVTTQKNHVEKQKNDIYGKIKDLENENKSLDQRYKIEKNTAEKNKILEDKSTNIKNINTLNPIYGWLDKKYQELIKEEKELIGIQNMTKNSNLYLDANLLQALYNINEEIIKSDKSYNINQIGTFNTEISELAKIIKENEQKIIELEWTRPSNTNTSENIKKEQDINNKIDELDPDKLKKLSEELDRKISLLKEDNQKLTSMLLEINTKRMTQMENAEKVDPTIDIQRAKGWNIYHKPDFDSPANTRDQYLTKEVITY